MKIIQQTFIDFEKGDFLRGGDHMQNHPNLSKLIQGKPFLFRELYLGIFKIILAVILLSCGTTPPIYFLENPNNRIQ